MLLSICLLSCASPQQSIQRETTYEVTQTGGAEVTPGIGTNFLLPSVSVEAQVVFEIPTGDGVHLRQVFVDGRVSGRKDLDAAALNASATKIFGSTFDGRAICGGGCIWGPSEHFTVGNSFGSDEFLDPGESLVLSAPLGVCGGFMCGGSQTYTEGGYQWSSIVSGPNFLTSLDIYSTQVSGTNMAGDPTPFQLNALTSTLSATTTVITRYELDAAPLTEYCTSPVGSTGAPATLAAFGSQQEGTEYLTIRADNLPAESFALLCIATASEFQPMGSYNLCIGGVVRRGGGVQPTGTGSADFDIELSSQTSGETVYLQTLFRDAMIGVGATNASSFIVQPN